MKTVHQDRFNTKGYSKLHNLESIDIFRYFDKLIHSFESTYFILEASTLKIKNSCQPLLNFFGITNHFFNDCSLFELIVENIHPSDVHKIEDYLNFIHSPDKTRHSNILKLKNSYGSWRQIYMNMVVDQSNHTSCPEHVYVCCIDLTDLMESESQSKQNSSSSQSNDNLKLIASLSKREKEILRLVVQGYTDKEVACELNISSHTAITHRKNIISKLKVKNTASLAFTAGTIGVFY
ncbi:response regulator transcription factor [Ancylomarina sp.]|uniref:response regulator transcription factor n=1 Tax=Ancylomarina sp. TaxID=1970196 RepID=UPI00356B49DC